MTNGSQRWSGEDKRGSSYDRRARKRWLLKTFGDGKRAKCAHCPTMVTYTTMTVDRIIPGWQGGSYRRDNIQPSCAPCNFSRGAVDGNAILATEYETPF